MEKNKNKKGLKLFYKIGLIVCATLLFASIILAVVFENREEKEASTTVAHAETLEQIQAETKYYLKIPAGFKFAVSGFADISSEYLSGFIIYFYNTSSDELISYGVGGTTFNGFLPGLLSVTTSDYVVTIGEDYYLYLSNFVDLSRSDISCYLYSRYGETIIYTNFDYSKILMLEIITIQSGGGGASEEELQNAYREGYQTGTNDGYTSGHEAGLREGLTQGYNNGFESGKAEGFDEGYNSANVNRLISEANDTNTSGIVLDPSRPQAPAVLEYSGENNSTIKISVANQLNIPAIKWDLGTTLAPNMLINVTYEGSYSTLADFVIFYYNSAGEKVNLFSVSDGDKNLFKITDENITTLYVYVENAYNFTISDLKLYYVGEGDSVIADTYFDSGYDTGYEVGYNKGLAENVASLSGFDAIQSLLSSAFSLFEIKIFGWFGLGDIVAVVLIIGIVFFLFKLVRG